MDGYEGGWVVEGWMERRIGGSVDKWIYGWIN